MSLHAAVAEYLGSAVDGLAYSAVTDEGNVFVDNLPTTPDRAVGLYSSPAPESDLRLEYDFFDFQVLVRCEEGSTWAIAMWEKIYRALHGLRNYALPDGTYLVWCLATSASAHPLGGDANGRPAYSGDFRAEVIDKLVTHR